MKNLIFLTGGTGFIGSHTAISLIKAGYDVMILDNLINSHKTTIDRIKKITGKKPSFIEGDIRDLNLLEKIFSENNVSAVIHFAALKSISESVQKPLEYYDNNVTGTIALLTAMKKHKIKRLVFSSSATVYGAPASVPIREDFPLFTTNPYGQSKLMIEEILDDLNHAEEDWRIARLRYFNPVGAHESGFMGEDPEDIPNNLMPYIAQVAIGKRKLLHIFGNDYPTIDGTGIRDYIHVMDLAEGHVTALDYLYKNTGMLTVNLGTGQGTSVLQMLHAFETVSGKTIPYEIAPRRAGDIAKCWADVTRAKELLNWTATRNLKNMCEDTWRWQQNNPHHNI